MVEKAAAYMNRGGTVLTVGEARVFPSATVKPLPEQADGGRISGRLELAADTAVQGLAGNFKVLQAIDDETPRSPGSSMKLLPAVNVCLVCLLGLLIYLADGVLPKVHVCLVNATARMTRRS